MHPCFNVVKYEAMSLIRLIEVRFLCNNCFFLFISLYFLTRWKEQVLFETTLYMYRLRVIRVTSNFRSSAGEGATDPQITLLHIERIWTMYNGNWNRCKKTPLLIYIFSFQILSKPVLVMRSLT